PRLGQLLDHDAQPGCRRRRHAVALGRARGDSAGQDDTSRIVKFELHRRARKQSLAPLSATAMATPLQWLAFNVFVLITIVLDLRVFHRKAHKIGVREAAIASFGWIGVSVLFGLAVLYYYGKQPALEYFTGYLIEKALSVDNLFLFLVIFRA